VIALVLALVAGCADLTRVEEDAASSSTAVSVTSSPDPSQDPPTGPPATVPGTPLDGVPSVPDAPATALVDRLRVAEPWSPIPYRRDEFGSGWDYDGRTGCNTRERVLAEESGPGLVVDDRCKPMTGTWRSAYDGLVTSDPADLEIDHLVPLAEAWRTGAAGWTRERRRAFANDLDDPSTLVAVSSRSNRSKQDSTPAGWLPADPDGRCAFVADWVRVKHRWGLTVAPDEKVAITQVLAGC
jgi:hypothetical protein